MQTHRLLSGEELEYPDPSPEIAAFLSRLIDMLHDPAKSESDFVALMYGSENPLLDHTIFKDRGAVTKAVYADPVYHLMLDLLGQKRVQTGSLKIDKVEARFTMTVAEAAKALGVSESAVRQAVAAHRLTSWRKDGRIFLDPNVVANFEVERRGPSPGLEVRYGMRPGPGGASFKIATDGELDVHKREHGAAASIEGTVPPGWQHFGVQTGHDDDMRFYLLEPGGPEDELAFEGWYVRGRFTIARKENNSREARKAFEAMWRDEQRGIVRLSPTKGRPMSADDKPKIEFVRELEYDRVPHANGGDIVDTHNARLFDVTLPGRSATPVYIWTSGHFLDVVGLRRPVSFDERSLRKLYEEIIASDISENQLTNRRQVGEVDRGRWGSRFVKIAAK